MKSSEICSAFPHPVLPQLGGCSISVRIGTSERARDDSTSRTQLWLPSAPLMSGKNYDNSKLKISFLSLPICMCINFEYILIFNKTNSLLSGSAIT